jgi:hypothetical protein
LFRLLFSAAEEIIEYFSSGDTFARYVTSRYVSITPVLRTTAAEKDVSDTDDNILFESASDSDEGSAGRKLLFHGVRVNQVR